jgi:signal transduction histidine kinase
LASIVTFDADQRPISLDARRETGAWLTQRVAVAAVDLALEDLLDYVSRLLVEALPIDGCQVSSDRLAPASPDSGVLRLPIFGRGEMVGGLSLSCDCGIVRLSSAQRTDLEGVAAVLALALSGARETREGSRSPDDVCAVGGLIDIICELNRTVAQLGIRVLSVSLANPQLSANLGGSPPDEGEHEALRAWQLASGGAGQVEPRRVVGALLIPVTHRASVLGVLRTSEPSCPVTQQALLALGSHCGELVKRSGLHQHLAEADHRRAVAVERDRIAQDLHDSVGQLITGIGLRLADHIAEAPDDTWRGRLQDLLDLTARGSRELRDSIDGLLFREAEQGGLETAIRNLCRDFEAITGVVVGFSVGGRATSLATAKEDALFRVAHEALLNVEHHAEASMAAVALSYGDEVVSLSVRDDGAGFGHRTPVGRPGHFGIRTMRRRIEDVGGDLDIRPTEPYGVVVEAVIPNRKRTAHGAGTRSGRR